MDFTLKYICAEKENLFPKRKELKNPLRDKHQLGLIRLLIIGYDKII